MVSPFLTNTNKNAKLPNYREHFKKGFLKRKKTRLNISQPGAWYCVSSIKVGFYFA